MNRVKSNHIGSLPSLERNGKKHRCPSCGKPTFVRYVTANGDYIADHVGRCDREVKCCYHFKPRDYFAQTGTKPEPMAAPPTREPELPPIYLEPERVTRSMAHYEENSFIKFLSTVFDTKTVQELIGRYLIGTSNHQFTHEDYPGEVSEKGASIFYQIGIDGRIHRGKVMLFDSVTGKRRKWPNRQAMITSIHARLAWTHKDRSIKNRKPPEVLFGAHLLGLEPHKPVAIVESEKTAIICSALMPEKIWLATGMLGNLKPELFEVLRGRKITLYPDLGAFEKWEKKATEIHGLNISMSITLEEIATLEEREQGLDLADFILKELREKPTEPRTEPEPPLTPTEEKTAVCETLPVTARFFDESVKQFLVSNTRPHEAGFINKDILICWYADYCRSNRLKPLDRYKFIGELQKHGHVIGSRLVFGLEALIEYFPVILDGQLF